MAAPHIPNLLASRHARGAGIARGRGRGRPDHDSQSTDAEKQQAKDRIVQATDGDASVSRLSAVELGYLDDVFAKCFVAGHAAQRRFPIINRGTYVRTTAIDHLVAHFLAAFPSSPTKQIVSLGAGSDTRFFRLQSLSPPPDLLYHELDFPSIAQQKVGIINGNAALRSLSGLPSSSVPSFAPETPFGAPSEPPPPLPSSLHTQTYHLHALDLRSLSASLPPSLASHLSSSAPTLILSECCLAYLNPATCASILASLTSHFPPSTPLCLILYEPTSPHDPFGRTMLANLRSRGIELSTIQTYPSLEAQRERLKSYGFIGGQGVRSVRGIWEGWVGTEEKERVGGLEMLDEVEEWDLLAEHYCVVWGWRGGEEGDWRAWAEVGK